MGRDLFPFTWVLIKLLNIMKWVKECVIKNRSIIKNKEDRHLKKILCMYIAHCSFCCNPDTGNVYPGNSLCPEEYVMLE
jgi:hypothetical protein